MGKIIDLEGQKFSRLTVVKLAYINKHKTTMWECLCDCGNTTTVRGYCLRNGHTKSCGCLSKETLDALRTTHGRSRNDVTYTSWLNMNGRCNNPNIPEYQYYGGRGISVEDPRWELFENFLADMGERPDGTSLDRIDVERGYYKENCRWTTRDEQTYNQRMPARNTSGKVGVEKRQSKLQDTWIVNISVNGKRIYLGSYHDFELACFVRDEAELKYYGYHRTDIKVEDKPDI